MALETPLRLALVGPASAVHTVRWANALAERGHEVHLFSLHPPQPLLGSQVRLHRLPFPAPLGYFAAAGALRQRLAALAPDLVNAHYASGYGTLARRCGFRPWALSVWGSDIFEFPRRSRWHRRLLVRNLQEANRVLSTSRAMAAEVRRLAPAAAEPHLTPFGVATAAFRPELRQGHEDEWITVGTVKKLAPAYGIDRLLYAFAAARERIVRARPAVAERLRLCIGGDGPDRRQLQRQARRLGVADRVTFSGPIPHDEVPAYLAGLDIFAALSRAESFGVAVLEASACGLPVVVSDVGGLPEVVVDGETGRIVPDGDLEAAAGALVDLIEAPAGRRRMGAAGRDFVRERYEWADCVARMEAALAGCQRCRGAAT